MLSLQEISDRFEIQDLVHRYAQIIDSKDFDSDFSAKMCKRSW